MDRKEPAMPTGADSNAEVRAAVLTKVDERLHEMFPVGQSAAAVSSFDELEAAATVTGDALARELMQEALKSVLAVKDAAPPERCPDCGTKLKHVEMPKTIATIRGLVGASRVWCKCRKCRKAFFPE
jgi:uncharacterized protein with PIN domain